MFETARQTSGRRVLLILASSSPRRVELLTAAGFQFRVVPPGIDERAPRPLSPLGVARWAASAKAEAVATRFPAAVVIGADTVVALEGRTYGKPQSPAQGRAVLRALSGRTHLVYTAVTVIDGRRHRARHGFSRTSVTMCELSPSAIRAYVHRGEAQDKAGAYAIQGEGQRLVAAVRGPYDNVVGMPMRLVERLLQECGITIPAKNSDEGQQDANDHRTRTPRDAHRRPGRASARHAARGLRTGREFAADDHPEHRRRQRS
ncbi:MAG: Maf family protein [Candidatus Dormibacteraeota bacterium]|nr:Maf family protein [Candidatus Dormibacteraeota bacterium]